MSDPTAGADRLSTILLEPDCAPGLWASVDSGEMDHLVPELLLLRMEQDPIHRHKDVLAHTIAVVSKTEPRSRFAWAPCSTTSASRAPVPSSTAR